MEIPVSVASADAERLGTRLLTEELVTDIPTDAAAVHGSLAALAGLLRGGAAWAADVAAGAAPPHPGAARAHADALAALPPLPPDELEAVAGSAAADSLTILYISKLLAANVMLSDRLGTQALPIL